MIKIFIFLGVFGFGYDRDVFVCGVVEGLDLIVIDGGLIDSGLYYLGIGIFKYFCGLIKVEWCELMLVWV